MHTAHLVNKIGEIDMAERKSFRDLKIWQKADQIFDMVCEDAGQWPNTKITNAIVYQLLDAAGSISANIAEGYGRGKPGEFEQFLRYSRGSSAETENWLIKAKKQSLISESRYNSYLTVFNETGKMTSSFINRLRVQKNSIA